MSTKLRILKQIALLGCVTYTIAFYSLRKIEVRVLGENKSYETIDLTFSQYNEMVNNLPKTDYGLKERIIMIQTSRKHVFDSVEVPGGYLVYYWLNIFCIIVAILMFFRFRGRGNFTVKHYHKQ